MNLHHDEPKVLSTISVSSSREKQSAGTPIPGQAISSQTTDRNDSKLPSAIGMNNNYSLSNIMSSILEQSSPFPPRPVQLQHELFSSPSTLQQQIATLNNAELLQLLLHQRIGSTSRFTPDGRVDGLGFGVNNLSNPVSSIPSLGILQPTSTLGKTRDSVNTGVRVLCPARGMPADHDFEVSCSEYKVSFKVMFFVTVGFSTLPSFALNVHCLFSESTFHHNT